jgi:hypothetical protein
MVDYNGKNQAGDNPDGKAPLDCEQWEALLADKMDLPGGTLAPEDEARFVEHSRGCPGCAELLDQARQGQEWLKLLEEHSPAAPVDLLSRILARTQGAGREADYPLGSSAIAGLPGHGGRWGISFLPASQAHLVAARGAHNARLLMTAGMAFFSVALTLSVAGVRLTSVHAAELRPQVVQANVSRSFYGTKKQVVSFYENLRLVYEVESKMNDLRHDPTTPASGRVAPKIESQPPASPKTKAPAGEPGHAATDSTPGDKNGADKQTGQGDQVLRGWPMAVDYLRAMPRAAHKRVEGQIIGREPSAELEALPGASSKERIRI